MSAPTGPQSEPTVRLTHLPERLIESSELEDAEIRIAALEEVLNAYRRELSHINKLWIAEGTKRQAAEGRIIRLEKRYQHDLEEIETAEQRVRFVIEWLDNNGHLEEHSFTFPDGVTYYVPQEQTDPEPQPSDGPDYATNHAFWEMRQRKAGKALPECTCIQDEYRTWATCSVHGITT